MQHCFVFFFLFLLALLFVLKPGGSKALIAENILLRNQLIIINRGRKRSPNLTPWSRLNYAFLASLINPNRLSKVGIIIKPSMLLKFHKAMIKSKYQALFSNKSKQKPGPAGPSQEIINAILEMKKQNPRFG